MPLSKKAHLSLSKIRIHFYLFFTFHIDRHNNCLKRTGIIYKHSSFHIRHGSYDNLYSYEEITEKNAYKYKRKIKMLNTAVNREKEKGKWNGISHKAIFMFYDEFVEMYVRLLIAGDDKNAKNI